ncbi:HAMP domain-containing histidine kinase [Aetokthonos hydrillicola Thurmond2011]|jgi:two-component system OmpR family sensor kinase|uniref:histidine kinase n=1 Tax=Aetokthonos hydrillicola Thurmond2011 TaxID=2712845 RepID=A0AAP5I9N7_9CYAN|nr:two-component system sensor histidine kinase RppB [Aetokthonos hydrillicola]MBO3460260.1 two-component sensor histidine kinase [Aetokthonos hydrillicola CCALA 1050]MBW4586993.1 HAMP domain-containing histidine kinase [Aetokthonos hydrillicola CCALA 1050]MDR9897532.1 HAMP domain-containing histidine kinase [Aetokthonos hydrillicola Thurmond2011]
MNQDRLFKLTRIRLALSYAGVMAVILAACGFGLYKAVSHAHWVTLDREIESVGGTLHDSIELKLRQPGRLEPVLEQLLPNICPVSTGCMEQQLSSKRHILSAINKGNYYVRFFDNSGNLIAIAGFHPKDLPLAFNNKLWQTIKDSRGNLYHQISFVLHTQDNRHWGYLQVGRSLEDFSGYLSVVKLILFVGLPLAMALVAVASWWLAGLAMQPIYQSYKQIQQFTADVAHELRTPLAATRATVESALMTPELDEIEAREILQTVERQNLRLTNLVADLLLLSRLDRQSLTMRHELCCLNEIVSDLIEEFAAMASKAKVSLTSLIQVPQPLSIVCDSEQLYRLISNLIVNAIQYTPDGGKVIVTLNRNETHVVIGVEDTGIGIPEQELSRIFDRFYRVNSDRSRSTGGSGLGLAISQAIIKAHYGSLAVQSELGKGSTFTIRLPLH